MDFNNLANTMEIKYLELLSSLLKSGEIDVDKAREISQEFFLLLPFENFDDIKNKIERFLVKNKEFENLRIILLKNIEEVKTSNVLEKMRTLLKNNKIDEAISLSSNK